jgi:hypothetical protein
MIFPNLSVRLPFHPLHEPVLSACLFILFLSLSVSLPFHPLSEPVCQLSFHPLSETACQVAFSYLSQNLSVSLPFHPLPEHVCQFAFSSSFRASLFPLVLKSVCQHAKMYSSIALKRKLKMLSKISDLLF